MIFSMCFFPLFARHDFIDLQPKKNIESSVHMKAMVGQIGGMNLATETVEFYTPWISVISRNVMEFKHAACRSCKGWFDDRPILMWKNRCQWVHIRLFEFGILLLFLINNDKNLFPYNCYRGFPTRQKYTSIFGLSEPFFLQQSTVSWQTSKNPTFCGSGEAPGKHRWEDWVGLLALRCWCARSSTSCSKSWGRLWP